MKKLYVVLAFMLVFALAGCDAFSDGSDPISYQDDFEDILEKLDELDDNISDITEVPVIVKDVQIIELPAETIIEYVDVEVINVVYAESRSLFYPSEGGIVVFVVAKGSVSYIFEFEYHTPLVGNPYGELIKVEKQLNGIQDGWFLLDEHDDQTFVDVFYYEVLDWNGFLRNVEHFRDDMEWSEFEEIYSILHDAYYG